jgi:diaminopimelate decarboxylase
VIDDATLARVHELQIPVNAGSVDMLEQLGQVSPGHRVWLRVNPGLVTVIAKKPTPAAKTASTGSGMPTCLPRWRCCSVTT